MLFNWINQKKMENYIFLIFILFILFSSHYNLESYKLSSQGENLLLYSSNHEYLLYENEMDNTNIKLIRRITKTDNNIIIKNFLAINNNEQKEVEFEGIGSLYNTENKIIICPKGKFHPFEYFDNLLTEIIPLKFKENGNWDLKCFQKENEQIQVFYLMNGNHNSFIYTNQIFELDEYNLYGDELYDVKLVKDNEESSETTLFKSLNDGNIKLFTKNSKYNDSKIIIKAKSFSKAYFSENENTFYFISWNNFSDIISGYAKMDNIFNLSSLNIKNNNYSPFNFEDDIEIKEINFIPNTPNIYYKIHNKKNGNFYYGVIDIITNKIILNIEEELSIFKLYSKNSILAINSISAYRISLSDDEFNFNNKFPLFSLESLNCYELCRYCSEESTSETDQKCTECISNFILDKLSSNCVCENGKEKIDKICIDCINQCKKYKLNTCNCTECNEGSYLDSDLCKTCPIDIKTCPNSNCCSNCEANYFWYNNKCLKCNTNCNTTQSDNCKCSTCNEGYYLIDYQCQKCDTNCKTCSGSSNYCLSCNEGYFLLDNKCSKCSNDCKTCENNSTFCTGCDDNKFLYEGECLDCANNCLTRDSDNCKCLTCFEKYEKVNYQCKLCDNISPSCSHYETNKCTCDSCNDGYYLNNHDCLKCDDNCKSCQNEPTICTGCKDNYFWKNDKCYECTECKETQPYSCRCRSCDEGKYLDNEQCKDCQHPCQTCDVEPQRCGSCKEGYYFYQYKCYECYERCKYCKSSPDSFGHHCTECKENYVILNDSCLENCPEGYYENTTQKSCELCNPLCKTRGEDCNKCESCKDGYYLIEKEYKCEQCNSHCKTCKIEASENNENCESCDTDSEFKYLVNATGFGNNCVSQCPDGTVLKNNICILYVPENEDDNSNTWIILISIFGSLVVIALVIVLFICLRRRRLNNPISIKKKVDDKLIDEINKDLHLYQSFT